MTPTKKHTGSLPTELETRLAALDTTTIDTFTIPEDFPVSKHPELPLSIQWRVGDVIVKKMFLHRCDTELAEKAGRHFLVPRMVKGEPTLLTPKRLYSTWPYVQDERVTVW